MKGEKKKRQFVSASYTNLNKEGREEIPTEFTLGFVKLKY